MERSAFDEIRLDVWKKIKEFYGDRVKGMEFYDIVDEPDMWTFKIGFFAYDYFWVVFRYKLDEIRMSICCGDGRYFHISSGEDFYSTAKLDEFFEDARKEIELRIPDKFLKAKGWSYKD